MKNFKSYSWILNFGVVPLFLLAAFLFAPAFFFLLALLVSVILVFDTIVKLLQFFIKDKIRRFLHLPPHPVKVIMLILLFSLQLFAKEAEEGVDLVISNGEQKELDAPKLLKFSVGNKEVISVKHLPKKGSILLKGKKLGFSDLVIWENSSKKVTYRIYVINKQKQLEILHLVEMVKSLDLTAELFGTMIKIKGVITKKEQLLLLQKLQKDNAANLIMEATIAPYFASKLMGSVYKKLFDEGLEEVSCSPNFNSILCEHSPLHSPTPELSESMRNDYFTLFSIRRDGAPKNYRLKVKLIQIEKLDGQEISFGLDKLNAKVGDLFSTGLTALVKENQIMLNNQAIDLSTIAEPEGLLQFDLPFNIEVGADIPFPTGGKLKGIEWKFAGVQVTLTAKPIQGKIRLEYKSQFTAPSAHGVQGSKESSTVLITPGESLELFQIGYRASGNIQSALPLIGKIPLLGALFASKGKQNNYKKISCFVQIVEE